MSSDKAVAQTVRTQLELYRVHESRLVARRDRFASDSIEYALQQVHVVMTLEKVVMLRAILDGKTVQPS